MEIKSSIAFDDELKKINFFKGHECMLPFVGEKYREVGILHIGKRSRCCCYGGGNQRQKHA